MSEVVKLQAKCNINGVQNYEPTHHLHIHDKEGKHIGDVCGGAGGYYVSRLHYKGAKKWHVAAHHASYNAAVKRMTAEFLKLPNVNKADVVFCSDYYDPMPVCEMVKR